MPEDGKSTHLTKYHFFVRWNIVHFTMKNLHILQSFICVRWKSVNNEIRTIVRYFPKKSSVGIFELKLEAGSKTRWQFCLKKFA